MWSIGYHVPECGDRASRRKGTACRDGAEDVGNRSSFGVGATDRNDISCAERSCGPGSWRAPSSRRKGRVA